MESRDTVRAVRPVREGGVRKRPDDGCPKGLNAPTSYFHGIAKKDGNYREPATFRTSGKNLRQSVGQVEAEEEALTLEEGPLAFSTARVLDGVVDRTVFCVPRENYLISRLARKDDETDAKALARLLRLGEVKAVYQRSSDRHALFKQAASHYTDLRDQQRALKQKIKARLKRWGLRQIPSTDVYSKSGRTAHLEELSHDRIRTQAESL